ncbi:MAG: hypothetical protein PVG14_07200 [Anaerolineales bacterium]
MRRSQLLKILAEGISAVKRAHPTRVAIDGVDASGKTTLADELVHPLQQRGADVIRASIDGFHNPRAIRYRQGTDSPQGYYQDSFNLETLKLRLLEPLGPGGSLRYQSQVFDLHRERALESPIRQARKDSILLFDGIFLMRPELRGCWDFRIFIEVEFEVVIERVKSRDQELFGTPEQVHQRYIQRYIPAQRAYLQSCQPKELADVIVDNNDVHNPQIRTPLSPDLTPQR